MADLATLHRQLTDQELKELLSRPPVPPVDLAELYRQNEEAIAAYQARMREIPPTTYQRGDRFELCGEISSAALRAVTNGIRGSLWVE